MYLTFQPFLLNQTNAFILRRLLARPSPSPLSISDDCHCIHRTQFTSLAHRFHRARDCKKTPCKTPLSISNDPSSLILFAITHHCIYCTQLTSLAHRFHRARCYRSTDVAVQTVNGVEASGKSNKFLICT